MQNINQRTPEQKLELEQKRKEALRQYVGGAIVFVYCIQTGIRTTWEWSQSCQGWRLPLIQHTTRKYELFYSIVRGCQVGRTNMDNPCRRDGSSSLPTNSLRSAWTFRVLAVETCNMWQVKDTSPNKLDVIQNPLPSVSARKYFKDFPRSSCNESSRVHMLKVTCLVRAPFVFACVIILLFVNHAFHAVDVAPLW